MQGFIRNSFYKVTTITHVIEAFVSISGQVIRRLQRHARKLKETTTTLKALKEKTKGGVDKP